MVLASWSIQSIGMRICKYDNQIKFRREYEIGRDPWSCEGNLQFCQCEHISIHSFIMRIERKKEVL